MKKTFLAAVACLLVPNPAAAQDSRTQASPAAPAEAVDARAARLDQLFSAAAAQGGSFVVRYDLGGESFAKGYGHLDCARTKPMPASAVIDSGSLTKLITAAAVHKLVEEGRLRLDDRLETLFPGVPRDKRAITVAQLVSHHSGLPDFMSLDGRVLTDQEYDIDKVDYLPVSKPQMLKLAFGAKLLFEPGTRERYSNFGYQLLAAVIEKASGRDYESYVREKILLPAGMKDTGYRLPDFRGKALAEQCRNGRSWGDPVTKGLWKNGVSWFLIGAGGMMTTADDLAAWTEALGSGKLFRPDIQERFRRARPFTPSYARCKTEVLAIAGSNGLTYAAISFLPLRKEALIAVSTRSDHQVPEAEAFALLCPK